MIRWLKEFVARHVARARGYYPVPTTTYGLGQQHRCLGCNFRCCAPDWLPDDWFDYPNLAAQSCQVNEDCTCWGGDDRECESCWIESK